MLVLTVESRTETSQAVSVSRTAAANQHHGHTHGHTSSPPRAAQDATVREEPQLSIKQACSWPRQRQEAASQEGTMSFVSD